MVLAPLVSLAGCYSRLVPAPGTEPIVSLPAPEHPFASAGILLDEASVTPRSAFFTADDVAERFAKRVARAGVFRPVSFPYPQPGIDEPEVMLGVTVRLEEKDHLGANLAKTVLHVSTLLTSLPVLPYRIGSAVDLSVIAFDPAGSPLGSYAARSEFALVYSFLELPRDAEDQLLFSTADHAIEAVVNQIKRDYAARRPRSVRAGRSAAWSAR